METNRLSRARSTLGSLLIMLQAMDAWAGAPVPHTTVWSSSADLNADGVVDSIRVILDDGDTSFPRVLIQIGAAQIRIKLEGVPEAFSIVDIDTTDTWQEVALWDQGQSDDYNTNYFWFDGSRVLHMGDIPGREPICHGSGRVTGDRRGNILHTWSFPAIYQITNQRSLEFLPQSLYPMNTPVRILQDVPLYLRRGDPAPRDIAPAGDCGVILETDDVKWCRLRTVGGHHGWFLAERGFFVEGKEVR